MTNPISPLRQRMIDDMTMRNLSPSTHETYIRAPLRRAKWVVYAKKPFAGPKQVLAYLARYTRFLQRPDGSALDLDYKHGVAETSHRIARRLNQRPRKTLGFETPADRLQAVLH